jgi:small subunit ribosomal protein S1
LHQGDKVLVFIVQPESPEGQIILSLDRARGERGWRVLQDSLDENQAFEGYITGSNKGGLLVNVEGVNAFVPLSQLVSGPDRGSPENTQQALTQWVGKNITLKVIELNRRRNRAILSERAAMQERRAADKERLLLELNEGDVKTGRITSIRDFGIFVDIGGADGLVHLSELSWERTPKTPNEMFKVGEDISVYILKVDNESKKIALSVRRAQPERWEEIVSGYREGQIVPGQVTKLAPFGAFVRLEGPIEGLIHISELVDRRINHPKEVVEEGDVVPVKVVRIEYDRHRLGLSLRQAREKSEEDGWVFNESGGPVSAPQEALDRMGVSEQSIRSKEPSIDAYAEEESTAAGDAAPAAEAGAEEPAFSEPEPELAALSVEEPPVDEAEPELTESLAEASEETAVSELELDATEVVAEEPDADRPEPEATDSLAEESEEPAISELEPELAESTADEPDVDQPESEASLAEESEEPAISEPEPEAAEVTAEESEEPAADEPEIEPAEESVLSDLEPEAAEVTAEESDEPATDEPEVVEPAEEPPGSELEPEATELSPEEPQEPTAAEPESIEEAPPESEDLPEALAEEPDPEIEPAVEVVAEEATPGYEVEVEPDAVAIQEDSPAVTEIEGESTPPATSEDVTEEPLEALNKVEQDLS